MKKYLILALFLSLFLIPIARAVICEPTVTWSIDSQFYVGETGKLIANSDNPCEDDYKVKVEVNSEKTQGYVKVYTVFSEDQAPMPRIHTTEAVSASSEYILDQKGGEGSKKKIIFFIQPDELTLPGTYSLFENFYIKGVLKQSKEVRIQVLKPFLVSNKIPSLVKFNTPYSSSITINNAGTEIINSLKICLSSPDDVVSFSDLCKTWTNLPSKYVDTFNFILTGLSPGSYQNIININMNYTTYTGLTVSDSYILPSLMITTTQTGAPSLSYSFTRGTGSFNLLMSNKGNGTAFNCLMKMSSPTDCLLNSSYLKSYTKSGDANFYEVECGDEIPLKGSSNIIFTFNHQDISTPCLIKGIISYKDGTGKSFETKINDFTLTQLTTTIPPEIPEKKVSIFVIIVILIIVAMIIIELVYLKYKKPEIYTKITQPFKKIFEKISQVIKKPKLEKKE